MSATFLLLLVGFLGICGVIFLAYLASEESKMFREMERRWGKDT